jgi:hypothetical protein
MLAWSLLVPIPSNPQRSKRIMAQTSDEIAKDIIVAWLSRTEVRWSFDRATEAGEAIGKVYKAVLQAVIEGIEIINLTLKVRRQTTLLGALHAIAQIFLKA